MTAVTFTRTIGLKYQHAVVYEALKWVKLNFTEVDVEMEESSVAMKCSNSERCLAAEEDFLKRLPAYLVAENTNGKHADLEFLSRLTNHRWHLEKRLKTAIDIILECFKKYEFGEIFVCFNGGKDCTVLFALVHYTWEKLLGHPGTLQAVYFKSPDSFQEMDSFVRETCQRYGAECDVLPTPIKESLGRYLASNPSLKAGFVGVRNSDPTWDGTGRAFQKTTRDWPHMMRVCPLHDWTYKDVWDFLRCCKIPYCPLYDFGYTSIDNKTNSIPNEALMENTEKGVFYKKAFLLEESRLERSGRI